MAIKVGGTTVIDDSRALSNIASVDATTAAAITAAGVGGADVIKYYDLPENISNSSTRHFIRTNYIYMQDGTKVVVWDKVNKTSTSTTITGLKHLSFISDTLAVGISTTGIFKVSVSGTTLTKGTETTLPATANSLNRASVDIAVGLSSTQAAVLCSYSSTDNFPEWSFAAVDISGSTPSIGTITSVYVGGQYQSVTWHGARVRNGNQFIATGKHNHSSGEHFGAGFYVSGTTLSYDRFIFGGGSTSGPTTSDFGLPYPLNEADALPFVPNPAIDGYFAGPYLTGYPNLMSVGFSNTSSAAVSQANQSPSGALQATHSAFNRATPVTTTTNNGEYYILHAGSYTQTNRLVYRYLYRVQANNALSNHGDYNTAAYDQNTSCSILDIPSTDYYLDFFDTRSNNTSPMQSGVRKTTINTSNNTFSNSLQTNSLPTSGSSVFTMTTLMTLPMTYNGELYLFEQDFYSKSDDEFDNHTPGRVQAYVPYQNVEEIRVIGANLAIAFSTAGTKMVEVTG
tara:strand:+ start:243 stop:1778 length:1536 start_codon:yes stop_codon:yes gene_type:complete